MGLISDNQVNPLLHAAGICGDIRKTHYVVAQPVTEIRLASYLCLGQYHDFKAANMDRPNGLSADEAPDISDVVGTKG